MNLLPIFLARQTDKNILCLMQVSLGLLQSSKWTQLHWELKENLGRKQCNPLLGWLDVDYCILGCSTVWINPQSICYSFSFLSLLTRIYWADPCGELGRFDQLLLTIKHKLTPLYIFPHSSITGSLRAVTYQELGQCILINDCVTAPLKCDHQSTILV